MSGEGDTELASILARIITYHIELDIEQAESGQAGQYRD